MSLKDEGLRYNSGKLPWDLIPVEAVEEMLKVLESGAVKYSPRNWEKGLSWSQTAASAFRHLSAFLSGEDKDPETGHLHVAHLMCNAAFLAYFYYHYPMGDDRVRGITIPRVTLDVDDVLADFVGKLLLEGIIRERPRNWEFSYDFITKGLSTLQQYKDFWLTIEPLEYHLPFTPVAYVSSRRIPMEWTKQWIESNQFPTAPVIHTDNKVQTLLSMNIDFHVDDNIATFQELRSNGMACYLRNAFHNIGINAGHWRINSLKEIPLLSKLYPGNPVSSRLSEFEGDDNCDISHDRGTHDNAT
jgi:hypothetical protein